MLRLGGRLWDAGIDRLGWLDYGKNVPVSINDPIEVKYDEKRDKYFLQQGRETFYDKETREWILFHTLLAAATYAHVFLGAEEIDLSMFVEEREAQG